MGEVDAIIVELLEAQERPYEEYGSEHPFPRLIGDGKGTFLHSSEKADKLINVYLQAFCVNHDVLLSLCERSEVTEVSRRVLAEWLLSGKMALDDELFNSLVKAQVDSLIGSYSFCFAANSLDGDHIADIHLGPVRIMSRGRWLDFALERDIISEAVISAMSEVQGSTFPETELSAVDRRKVSWLRDAFGSSRQVCFVDITNCSPKVAERRALLLARMALTCVSLTWQKPSQILSQLSLSWDAQPRLRHYAVFDERQQIGSNASASIKGRGYDAPANWPEVWEDYKCLMKPLSSALRHHAGFEVELSGSVADSLLMSLLLFNEACEEQYDFLAIAKFASSMDALTGGQRSKAIVKFIEYRLQRKPHDAWFTDGRTPTHVVHTLYNIVRNGVFHGSIRGLQRDWKSERRTAEVVARSCLIGAAEWLAEKKDIRNIKTLAEAGG